MQARLWNKWNLNGVANVVVPLTRFKHEHIVMERGKPTPEEMFAHGLATSGVPTTRAKKEFTQGWDLQYESNRICYKF